MTCRENCIHYAVCYKKPDHFDDLEVNGGCSDFQDKSEWVHLPCKKGDVLERNGERCEVDHWNVIATTFAEGEKLRLFNVEDAEKALKDRERKMMGNER